MKPLDFDFVMVADGTTEETTETDSQPPEREHDQRSDYNGPDQRSDYNGPA